MSSINTKMDVPKLNPANYGPWLVALKAAAHTTNAIEHLNGNPTPPTSETQLQEHNKKKHNLVGIIISTIPNDIANLLIESTSEPTPYELLTTITNHLDTTNTDDHKFVRQEAEDTQLHPGTTLEEYVKNHEQIRAKMLAAKYPDIAKPETTVEFMIEGLKHNPDTTQIGLQLMALNPINIKDFVHKYKRITSYQNATATTAAHTLPQAAATYKPNTTPYRRTTRRHTANFKPCYFHMALGLRQPQHSDAQCRHPEHPKNKLNPKITRHWKTQAKAREAKGTGYYDEQLYIEDQNESSETSDQGTSILDSAAHPTHTNKPTPSMKPSPNLKTTTATNDKSPCTHIGKKTIWTNKRFPMNLTTVINPRIKHNLISVHDITKHYGNVTFTPNKAIITQRTNGKTKTIGVAQWNPKLTAYSWKTKPSPQNRAARTIPYQRSNKTPSKAATTTTKTKSNKTSKATHHIPKDSIPVVRTGHTTNNPNPLQKPPSPSDITHYNWHLRLNHTPTRNIQKMAIKKTIPILPNSLKQKPPTITCSSCAHGKQHPQPHKRTTHNYPIGAYISSDTCGPITPISRQGNAHFLTFVDAGSRYLFLYLLKRRSEVAFAIPSFLDTLRNRYKLIPSIYRTDNAKEFQSNEMKRTYNKYGIDYRHNTPYQPQENSIAERINRTLMNATRAALHHANLNNTFWEDALRDVAYKYNIMIHSEHQKSPHEMWCGQPPKDTHIFTFGERGTIAIPTLKPKTKLEPRADPARYMHAKSPSLITVLNLRTNKYQQVRAVDFRPYNQLTDPVKQFPRAFKSTTQKAADEITAATPDPKTHSEARKYPDAELWEKAHNEELDKLDKNGTIKWIRNEELPPNERLIPLKMTYRYKCAPDGTIEERKARCAVRGDTMKPGIHYDAEKTSTQMAEKTSIRTLYAIAAARNWPIEHFDITSAYLHEKYRNAKPVYIKQHPQFNGQHKHKCKAVILVGNLYGTPPASHIYFDALAKHLKRHEFSQTPTDPSVFVQKKENNTTVIAVSMDDFLVVANQKKLIDALYQTLQKKYNIKRLGEPTKYLNWKVTRNADGSIHISQPQTIKTILEKMNMTDANPKETPAPTNMVKTLEEEGSQLDTQRAQLFRQTVGDLRYLTDSTRPDIFFTVNKLASVMHKPTDAHWHIIKWLLRYLHGTANHGITYETAKDKRDEPQLVTYSDADFANGKDRKSYTGAVHTINKAPIYCTSRKQSVVALSTCEAEYLAASTATQQTNWIRRLLDKIHAVQKKPTPHYIDNRAAIQVATSGTPTKRRKLMDIRVHHIQDNVARNVTKIQHITSKDNLADEFTKPLGKDNFTNARRQLNINAPPKSARQRQGGLSDRT